MIVLKSVSQINERLNSIFKLNDKFEENDFSFINQILPQDEIEERINQTGIIIGKEALIEELSLLIFQLKDYTPALCNLTNMFLLSKNYDAVYHFTTKLFISHVGNVTYHSEGNYNYVQRYFDRFIEIVKNCKILPQDYIPFILEIFKTEKNTPMIAWRAPALEYMKVFYSQNPDWVENFLQGDKRKFEMLSLLCQFNTQRGLALALEHFTSTGQEEESFLNLFKQNKKEVFLHIDKHLNKNDDAQMEKFAKILLAMPEDTEAKSRLEEIFKVSQNVNLRNLISQEIGLVENSSFKTEKQFLLAVRKQAKGAQERVLGLPFDKLDLKYKSGLKVDEAGYTFLINLFKEDPNLLNLGRYRSLLEIFDKTSLDGFLTQLANQALFKQKDINASKWAVRMLALLSDNQLKNEIYSFIKTLLFEGRSKEAKYLIYSLIASYKEGLFELFVELLKSENKNFEAMKEQILLTYSEYNTSSFEELLDLTVSENYDNFDFEQQKGRLFNAFISGRTYTIEVFEKLFINHKLFNKLGQGLVFGEYRYGGLHNAFILEDKEKKFIVSKPLSPSADIVISIVHPQDCDMRFQPVYGAIKNPTFNQFEEVFYNVKDFSRSSVSINVFAGMMIKPYEFAKSLDGYGFKANKEENSLQFNSFIHLMPSLDLVAEIELEKPIQLSSPHMTVANLYFYRYKDTLYSNGKYVTDKQHVVGVGSLPYRYFGYILTSIINSVKKSK